MTETAPAMPRRAVRSWLAGLTLAALAASSAHAGGPPGGCEPLDWPALMPAHWSPRAVISDLGMERMDDGDPAAVEALRVLRTRWDAAPANPAVAPRRVCLDGFVVPLRGGQGPIDEFLLVPYFGACIHEPSPPANQTVRVVLDHPLSAAERGDGAVRVDGMLTIERTQSFYGASIYRLSGATVEARHAPGAPSPSADSEPASHSQHAH